MILHWPKIIILGQGDKWKMAQTSEWTKGQWAELSISRQHIVGRGPEVWCSSLLRNEEVCGESKGGKEGCQPDTGSPLQVAREILRKCLIFTKVFCLFGVGNPLAATRRQVFLLQAIFSRGAGGCQQNRLVSFQIDQGVGEEPSEVAMFPVVS